MVLVPILTAKEVELVVSSVKLDEVDKVAGLKVQKAVVNAMTND